MMWLVDSTVIPSSITARVSIRIVPDQDLDTIARDLQEHLKQTFAALHSPNALEVRATTLLSDFATSDGLIRGLGQD